MATTQGSVDHDSDDFSEKPLPKLPKEDKRPSPLLQTVRRLCVNLWIWEMSSLLISVACVGAIMALLFYFDNKPLPEWEFGLTINGVLSVLLNFQCFHA